MHSFPARPANSLLATRIQPAVTRFADEVSGTLARLCAYAMTLALLAILGLALWEKLPETMVTEPSTKGGWSLAERTPRGFAVTLTNLHDKTETYEILRHPEGGRRDTFRWSDAGQEPVAELEIYRLGGEFHEAGRATAVIATRMDPDNSREFEAAGVIDSKFGAVTLLRPTGGPDTCLGFIKQIADPALRISGWSCLGDTLPARRAAVGCMLNRLILLAAGKDPKLAELFARAELRRSDCAPSGVPALSADWTTSAGNPQLRGAM